MSRQAESLPASCHCNAIKRVSGTLSRHYDAALAPLGLTSAQFSLLFRVFECAPCNKSELARKAGLERTTVVRNLEVMMRKGWVIETQRTSPSPVVMLTPEGRELVDKAVPVWSQQQREVEKALGEEGLAALNLIIEKVRELDQ